MNAPIAVGIDIEYSSGDALFWAVAEARRRHTWILLVHAVDAADAAVAAAAGIPASARAAELIRAHRRVANRLAPDLRTLGQVAGEAAPAALVAVSRRAQLLVLGSRGRAGLNSSALGSVSHQVVAHAHCPVVIVAPGGARLVTRRIAVGVAEGDAGHSVLDFAAAQARRWAATLCLVHGQAGVSEPAARNEFVDAAAYVRRHHPDVVVERSAAPVDPIAALIDESARSDLLVLGCRHTDAEFECRIGAIPAGVLPQVGCPVALVGRPRPPLPRVPRVCGRRAGTYAVARPAAAR